MTGLAEIQDAIEKLSPEERDELRAWLAAEGIPESDELVAAVDEGLHSSRTEPGVSVDEARQIVHRCATRSV